MSRLGVLAEGEELSTNPLRAFFNDLRTTQMRWMLPGKSWLTEAVSPAMTGEPVRGL